jgi:phage baseplate assembly protein W
MLKRLSPNASQESAKPAEAPVTNAMVKHLYERPPSFTDLLPWVEYNRSSRTFLLEDGISLGALFELTPAGTEARTPEFMTQLRDAIQTALTDAIPRKMMHPGCCRSMFRMNPACRVFRRRLQATHNRVRGRRNSLSTPRRCLHNTFRPPDLGDFHMTPVSKKSGKAHQFHGG